MRSQVLRPQLLTPERPLLSYCHETVLVKLRIHIPAYDDSVVIDTHGSRARSAGKSKSCQRGRVFVSISRCLSGFRIGGKEANLIRACNPSAHNVPMTIHAVGFVISGIVGIELVKVAADPEKGMKRIATEEVS